MEIPSGFEWQSEYDAILEKIASTDIVDVEWPKLRNIIKYQIDKNVTAFLSEPPPPRKPRIFAKQPLSDGSFKLPPFPPQRLDEQGVNASEIPPVLMSAEQANELKDCIFTQLHQFEDGPPFTIQRLCELCLRPREHYRYIGKYIRAVEKSVLVTSNHSAFLPPSNLQSQPIMEPISVPLLSATPTTPLFSPIPFLHEDARRSKSRSPPPSPLALASSPDAKKALGLVDELDDPSPGHLSDHVTPLSSTTTASGPSGLPFMGSLEDRFVKAKDEHVGETSVGSSNGGAEDMVLDDDADCDKENKA